MAGSLDESLSACCCLYLGLSLSLPAMEQREGNVPWPLSSPTHWPRPGHHGLGQKQRQPAQLVTTKSLHLPPRERERQHQGKERRKDAGSGPSKPSTGQQLEDNIPTTLGVGGGAGGRQVGKGRWQPAAVIRAG